MRRPNLFRHLLLHIPCSFGDDFTTCLNIAANAFNRVARRCQRQQREHKRGSHKFLHLVTPMNVDGADNVSEAYIRQDGRHPHMHFGTNDPSEPQMPVPFSPDSLLKACA